MGAFFISPLVPLDRSTSTDVVQRDTLSFAAWNALDLVNNIKKSETHFLALTLRKRDKAPSIRTMFALVDAAVLPVSILTRRFAEQGALLGGMPPMESIREFRAEALRDGKLGAVLIMSVELAKGEEMSPEEAVKQVRCLHGWTGFTVMTLTNIVR